MDKRFFIATNGMSADNRDKITKYLGAQSWGYWHWFSEVWIVTGVPHAYTAKSLHTQLEVHADLEGLTMIVVEIPEGRMSYWGVANEKAWEWMDSNLNR